MAVTETNTGITVKLLLLNGNKKYTKIYGAIQSVTIESSGDGVAEELSGLGLTDLDDSMTLIVFPDYVKTAFAAVRDAYFDPAATHEEHEFAAKAYDAAKKRLDNMVRCAVSTSERGVFDFYAYCMFLKDSMRDKRGDKAI